jgi:hypothetical protein
MMATVFPQGARMQPVAPDIAAKVFPNGARVQPIFELAPPFPPGVPQLPGGGGWRSRRKPRWCVEEDLDVARRAETLAAATAVGIDDGDEATRLAATIGLLLWGVPVLPSDD